MWDEQFRNPLLEINGLLATFFESGFAANTRSERKSFPIDGKFIAVPVRLHGSLFGGNNCSTKPDCHHKSIPADRHAAGGESGKVPKFSRVRLKTSFHKFLNGVLIEGKYS